MGYKRLGEPIAAVEYDPMDLIHFIQKNFGPLNLLMERAGMSEMDIYNRTLRTRRGGRPYPPLAAPLRVPSATTRALERVKTRILVHLMRNRGL